MCATDWGLAITPVISPDEMDHPIAALDVYVEFFQGSITGDDEVFLHLHFHIGASEQVAQALPVTQELSRNSGEKQLNPRHVKPAT